MTARDIPAISTPVDSHNASAQNAVCELSRKRTASLFLDFCADWILDSSVPGSARTDEDALLIELLKNAPGSSELINDLPGVLSANAAVAGPIDGPKLDQQPQLLPGFAPGADPSSVTLTAAAAATVSQPRHHRAVITSMPMPATTRAAAAGADRDDDTSSAATLPMPLNSRKRRREEDDDEASSSPNDLVEVPSLRHIGTTSAAGASGRGSSRAAAHKQQQHDAASSRDQSAAGTSSGAAAAAAAAGAAPSSDVFKGILVAKVLTKSDSSSKRIILPRIAVETNLPQLASATVFHFSATDPNGASWPLVIKAWANGSNPKPVYVMEQIGEVLKGNKLTVGDAVGLLADEEGNFYLEWNTDAVRTASTRPMASGITFKNLNCQGSSSGKQQTAQQTQSKQQQQPAAPVKVEEVVQQQAVAAVAPVQQQPSSPTGPVAAAAVSPVRRAPTPPPLAAPLIKLEQDQTAAAAAVVIQPPSPTVPAPAAAAAAAPEPQPQQQQEQQIPRVSSGMPMMTAVPVTAPQVRGTFIPTSPCQLLVMGHMPMPELDLDLDAGLQPSLPSGLLPALPSQLGGASVSGLLGGVGGYYNGLEPASGSDESLLVPTGPLMHAGAAVLLCPRTPGCTRPAGHQGWCLGHKGYKKRRV